MQEILTTTMSVLAIVALILVIALLVRIWLFTNSLGKLRKTVQELYNINRERLGQFSAFLTTLGIIEALRARLRRRDESMPR